jgi:hypothetical protein
MMAVGLIAVLLVVVALVVAGYALKWFGRREIEHSDRLQNADRPTLRYEVPPGQDPAAVLTELRRAGYDASADSEPGPSSPVVIIGTTTGGAPDREQLRATLDQMDLVNVDPGVDVPMDRPAVRFMDER